MLIMPILDHDTRNPRVLIHNAFIFRGLSYSYRKLPKNRLKLSILKLDGSSFGNLFVIYNLFDFIYFGGLTYDFC